MVLAIRLLLRRLRLRLHLRLHQVSIDGNAAHGCSDLVLHARPP
jgi:hypothetical protein